VRRDPSGPAILARDRQAAARAVACFLLAACFLLSVLTFLVPGYAGKGWLPFTATLICGGLMGLGGVACWRAPHRIPGAFWIVVPLIAVAVIVGLNLLTYDASAGAQFFMLWPVFYAATFLRRTLVYLVLAVVFVAEAGMVSYIEASSRALSDTAGLMTALIMATVIIVTLRKRVDRLLSALETQATTDPLTGLRNRRAFDRDLSEAVERCERTGEPLSLLTFDLDHFKEINDTWGHTVGDAALRSVADALREVCGRPDAYARLGGDEFVVLLESDTAGALATAAALRDAVAATQGLPSGPPTLSIGVATMPYDATNGAALVAASDAALYQAKIHGRDRTTTAGATDLLAPRTATPGPVRCRPATTPGQKPHAPAVAGVGPSSPS
jgi:diguanylate cyclase (GGDEF)-like protein